MLLPRVESPAAVPVAKTRSTSGPWVSGTSTRCGDRKGGGGPMEDQGADVRDRGGKIEGTVGRGCEGG